MQAIFVNFIDFFEKHPVSSGLLPLRGQLLFSFQMRMGALDHYWMGAKTLIDIPFIQKIQVDWRRKRYASLKFSFLK
jgi:hypothetical protein